MTNKLMDDLVKSLHKTELEIQREALQISSNVVFLALFEWMRDYHMRLSIDGPTVPEREEHRSAVRALNQFDQDLTTLGDNHA
jgi:hypothetical protein